MSETTTTTPRRQHGSGSVFQRADGRWVGRIEAGFTPAGGRRRIVVSGKTKAETVAKLKKKQGQIERDGIPALGTARTTVKAWAETWLEITERKVRPKTWATNRSCVALWIIPTIGHRRLDDLNPADVRALTSAMMKAGRSSSTAQRAQVILTKMLRDAILEGHQVPQRVLLVPAPSTAAHDRDAISVLDALALLRVATERSDGSRWVAALLQGMRQGECLGLTWDAVDLDKGTLDVSWQLQALPYLDRAAQTFRVPDGYEVRRLSGALHLVRPKSSRGKRIIPLVPWMTTALTTWRELAPASPHGLVWPRTDGRPESSENDRAAWHALQEAAGVSKQTEEGERHYLLHEARHTTATLLLEAGVDSHVITAIMGHASIVTTRGYQHVHDRMTRAAMEDVATRLGLTAG